MPGFCIGHGGETLACSGAWARKSGCRGQAKLGVPDDVGLQQLAMRLHLDLAIHHEILAAQREEGVGQFGEIGREAVRLESVRVALALLMDAVSA